MKTTAMVSLTFSLTLLTMGTFILWPEGRSDKVFPGSDTSTMEETPDSEDVVDASTRPLPDTGAAEENPVQAEVMTDLENGWVLRGRILRQSPGSDSASEWSESRPLAGAVVQLSLHPDHERADAVPPRQLLTEEDGVFIFAGVPGHLWLQLEIDEPSSAYYALNFRFGDPPSENIKDLGDLPVEPGNKLKIQMLGPRGKPVQNGTIQVKKTRRPPGLSDHLEALGVHESLRNPEERPGGIYVLDRAPLGRLGLEARAPGYKRSEPIEFINPPEEPLVIFLKEGAVISGIVHTIDHEPITNATLRARGRGETHEVTTNPDGRFVFDTLRAGQYRVRVRAARFVQAFRDYVPTGAEDLEFELAPAAILTGQIVTEENRPVAAARVSPLRVETRVPQQMVKSTDNGHFELNTLPVGTYRLFVDHPDFAPESHGEDFEIEVGQQEHTGPIVLQSGISVTGSVVNSLTRDPINAATVSFRLKGERNLYFYRPRKASTRADGTFSLGGLSEGIYSVKITNRGYLDSDIERIEITRDGPLTSTFTMQVGSSVSGRITNEAGEPIAGAKLKIPRAQLRKPSYETDLDGRYRIDFRSLKLSPTFWLEATHADYVPQEWSESRSFKLEPGESLTNLDFVLTRGGSITARVIDEMGQAITDTELGFKHRRTSSIQPVSTDGIYLPQGKISTDRNGRLELSRLRPGLYDIVVWASGVRALKEDIEVTDSSTATEIELVLSEAEILTGHVVDHHGNPVEGAKIDPTGNEYPSTRTGPNGDFEFTGLDSGRFSFRVEKRGFKSDGGTVSVPLEKELVIVLKPNPTAPPARVSGQVFAENTRLFPYFDILYARLATAGQAPWRGRYQVFDASGHFAFELAPGTYVLTAVVPGFGLGRSREFTLKEGETLENLDIDLPPEAGVVGTVVAAKTGEPVHGATIQLDSGEESLVRNRNVKTSSKPDGTFRLGEMPEGEIRLIASHPDFAPTREEGLMVVLGEDTEVRLEMHAGGGLHGMVLKADEPLVGAKVRAYKKSGANSESKLATTDHQGHYAISGLSPGLYKVSVSHGSEFLGFGLLAAWAEVSDDLSTERNFEQGARVRIRGVVYSEGVPLRGGRIELPHSLIIPSLDNSPGQVIEADGTYTLEFPEAGQYSLLIHARELGTSGIRVPLSIPRGKNVQEVDIDLPSGEIQGTVVDTQTGEPIEGARVFALATGSRPAIDQVLFFGTGVVNTDHGGLFVLSNLEAGTYALKVSRQGYSNVSVEGIRLSARARSANHEIELERGIAFQVRVVDENADPIQYAIGILHDAAGSMATSFPGISTEDGLLTVRATRPGPYTLTVSLGTYASACRTVKVEENARASTVVLVSGSVLQVQVLDNNSLPVEGASVELVDDRGWNVLDGHLPFKTVTDSNGVLRVKHASPGRFRVSATQNGARSQQQEVEIVAGKTNQITVQTQISRP
jgi:protocatechuate 3,4-dioxygenase beta subunit